MGDMKMDLLKNTTGAVLEVGKDPSRAARWTKNAWDATKNFLWSGGTKRKWVTGAAVTGIAAETIPGADHLVGGAAAIPVRVVDSLARRSGRGLRKVGDRFVENVSGEEAANPAAQAAAGSGAAAGTGNAISEFFKSLNIGPGSLIGGGLFAALGAWIGDPMIAVGLTVVGAVAGQPIMDMIMPHQENTAPAANTQPAAPKKTDAAATTQQDPAVEVPRTPNTKAATRGK